MMKEKWMDKQKEVIENMRERLHKEILNQKDGKLGEKQIIKVSQELDELIAGYYRSIKPGEKLQ